MYELGGGVVRGAVAPLAMDELFGKNAHNLCNNT